MNEFIESLTAEVDANRAMFEALCVACTPEQLGRRGEGDTWNVRDHIAHLASYDQAALLRLAPEAAATLGAKLDVESDEWNHAEVEHRRGRDRTTLRAEMAELRAQTLALLASLPEDRLEQEVPFPPDARRDAGQVPLRLWLERWSKHDMVHARAILAAVPELAGNADFQAWLADDPMLEALTRHNGVARAE